MNQAGIQAKINLGYGKAAAYLGVPCLWYRPTTISNPISASSLRGSIKVYFDSSYKFTASEPQTAADNTWAAAFDRTGFVIGDYIVDTTTGFAFFTIALQSLLPSSVVLCNAVLTIYRPGGGQQVGASFYGGNAQGYGTLILSGFPASVEIGSKGEQSLSGVMGDTRLPWVNINLPGKVTPQIKTNDLMIDDTGRRFTVSAVQQSRYGISCTAAYSGT